MDWLYDRIFVRPTVWLAQAGKGDFMDGFYVGVGYLTQAGFGALRRTQSGRIRWYAAVITAGTILFIAVVRFL
jgi:NADH-quinone oxidoreductase subunit L